MAEETPVNLIVHISTDGDGIKLDVPQNQAVDDRKVEVVDEYLEGEQTEIADNEQTEDVEDSDYIKGEYSEEEFPESEETEDEYTKDELDEEEIRSELEVADEGGEVVGEHQGELYEGFERDHVIKDGAVTTEVEPYDQFVEEEEAYIEEPPPDPAAPYNFSESQELLKEPYELRPDQVAEVEQLWAIYQNYTPAYTDIDNYITEKELIYMLKSLVLMTYTPEQLQELITFCVRPTHPKGYITYEQFLKMVTIRQRDFPVEEELRNALQILDPGKTGTIDRDYFREVLGKMGHKLPPRQVEHLIKEVDISNDGTVGIDDIVGTMCIDLNKDDIMMLREALYPSEKSNDQDNF